MPAWLVARVLPNQELPVTERLDRVGAVAYHPRYRELVRERRSSRPREVIRPVFPCYLFVRSEGAFYFIKEVEGVTSVVMDDGKPAQSTYLDRAIDEMIEAEDVNGLIRVPERIADPAKFVVGQRVRVLTGVFRSLLGTCHVATLDRRFAVLLDMFGRKVSVIYNEHELTTA